MRINQKEKEAAGGYLVVIGSSRMTDVRGEGATRSQPAPGEAFLLLVTKPLINGYIPSQSAHLSWLRIEQIRRDELPQTVPLSSVQMVAQT